MGEELQDSRNKYWYEDSIPIENRFYGVFEGGGAKGVAFNGALQAMKENTCWFRSVAGASAGAITAALIASGLSPDKIEDETDEILGKIKTGRLKGLWKLRTKAGYFPSDGLLDPLNEVIKEQVKLKTGAKPAKDVTFKELWGATGIELNVIAADLSLRRQIIFNWRLTPNCGVADAVVASCSIPFAFPSRLLKVVEGKKIVKEEEIEIFSHHTIVDGGVWSNFPMFIYEDKAFRKHYNLTPEEIDSRRILGFLLKEEDEETSLKDKDVEFVEDNKKMKVKAKEWLSKKKTNGDKPPGILARIGAWLLFPFFLFGAMINGLDEKGRWPPPKSRLVEHLIEGINGFLGGISGVVFGVLVCVITAIGALRVSRYFVLDLLGKPLFTDLTNLHSDIFKVLFLVGVCLVAIMALFVTVLGVFTNFFLLRASRRVFYGLITTFAAGPGASEWVEEKENVIQLPIPAAVKTLSFEAVEKGGSRCQPLIKSAKNETVKKLEKILNAIKNHKAPGK